VACGWLLAGTGRAGKFWHVSDLHLDRAYSVNGRPGEKLYCHSTNQTVPPERRLSPAGDYECDAPLSLVNAILKAMHMKEPEPDFIVWTGDSAPHVTPEPSYQYITNVTSMVYSKLMRYFPNTPIVSALGNHDSSPSDDYKPSSPDSNESQYYQYYHNGRFNESVGETEKNTFLKCGYYTKVFPLKDVELKFIVLNTNLYYSNKEKITEEDPCGQLEWLEDELTNRTGDNQKVFIVAHVPPGVLERNTSITFFNSPPEYSEQIEKRFLSLVVKPNLHSKIHAHLYGHIHTDTFRLFMDRAQSSEVRGVGFCGSSGTPLLFGHGVNPSIRLFDFDDADGSLLNYHQFGFYLDKFGRTSSQPKSRRKSLDDLNNPTRRRKRTTDIITAHSSNTSDASVPSDSINTNNIDSSPKTDPKVDSAEKLLVNEKDTPTPVVDNSSAATTTVDKSVPLPTNNRKTEVNNTPIANSVPSINSARNISAIESMDSSLTSNEDKADNLTLNKTDSIVVNTDKPDSIEEDKITLNKTDSTVANTDKPNSIEEDKITLNKTDSTVANTDKPDSIEEDKDGDIDNDDVAQAIADSFVLIYHATEAFHINNLSAEEMAKAYNMMAENKTIFNIYYEHNTVNHIGSNVSCDNRCYRGHMCAIKFQVSKEVARCVASNDSFVIPNISQSKSEENGPDHDSNTVTTLNPTKTDAAPESGVDPAISGPGVTVPPPIVDTDMPEPVHTTQAPPHTEPELVEVKAPIQPVAVPVPKSPSNSDHSDPCESDEAQLPHCSHVRPDQSDNRSVVSKIAGTILGVCSAMTVLALVFFVLKKRRQRRRLDQEFLLTDSVFRYDGYSQLDDNF